MKFLDFFRGSRDQRIATRFMNALRDAGDQRRLAFDANDRVVVAYDEQGHRAQLRYIGNLARELLDAPAEDHDTVYRRYALGATDDERDRQSSDYALVQSRLRILLKDLSYPSYVELLNRQDFPDSESSPIVFEHLVGDVIACCVEERDQSLSFVTQVRLTRWGVDAATVLSRAKANVCALPFQVSDPMPTRYVLNDDSFIASRLVNPRMFDGLPVRGEWVAVIPDRDTFFVADSDDMEAVAGLARLALRQFEAGERIISGLPFVLRNGSWQVYKPPDQVSSLFSNVALQYSASYWSDFKTVLEKCLEDRGEDIFVAALNVYEEKGVAALYSMAVWSKGVDTILPVVDRIYFSDDSANATRIGQWNDVTRVMGPSMHREPGWPERYRVRSFPSAEQLVAIGVRTV